VAPGTPRLAVVLEPWIAGPEHEVEMDGVLVDGIEFAAVTSMSVNVSRMQQVNLAGLTPDRLGGDRCGL
jgi:hypothetical protein